MKIQKLFFTSLFFFTSIITLPIHGALKENRLKVENEKPATIKVLLEKNSEGVLVEARGSFKVVNPEDGKKLSSGRKGKRFFLHPHKEGIQWGEDFPGIFQLVIMPTSPDTSLLINGIQYRGSLEFYHIDNKLHIVNEVDVESYLKSILSEKVSSKLPSAVLDAIAMVARTNSYYMALLNTSAYWHVQADEVGYNGVALTFQNVNMDRSIDNTRYLVMTYEDQPFPCTWTKHSAGKTASFESIFRKHSTTPKGVEATFAAKYRDDAHWSLVLNSQVLAKVVKTNRITAVDLFVDHPSNKVYALRVQDGSHTEDIDFLSFQNAIGQDKIKSNDFTISIKGNEVTFEGYGEGCGSGLCLFSASQMAERGDLAPEILSDFFPHTHLEKMRSFPEAITNKKQFFSPKQKKATERRWKVLHQ